MKKVISVHYLWKCIQIEGNSTTSPFYTYEEFIKKKKIFYSIRICPCVPEQRKILFGNEWTKASVISWIITKKTPKVWTVRKRNVQLRWLSQGFEEGISFFLPYLYQLHLKKVFAQCLDPSSAAVWAFQNFCNLLLLLSCFRFCMSAKMYGVLTALYACVLSTFDVGASICRM